MVTCRFVLSVVFVLGWTICPTAVDAAAIYIDFGDYQGSADSLVDGTIVAWNVVPTIKSFATLTLVDANSADTGIQISAMTGFDTGYDDTLAGGAWNVTSIPWSVGDATNDDFACNNSGDVIFSNLLGPYYRLELISSRGDSAANRVADYSVNGSYTTGSQSFSASLDGWGDKSIMIWDLVEPDANQQITLHLSATGGNWSYVNAIKLVAVPEPSTTLLLLSTVVMAVLSSRRRSVRHSSLNSQV